MKRQKQDQILLCISIACFFLMSVTFLVMPIETSQEKEKLINCLIGAVFWITMAAGIIMQIILARRRASWKKKNDICINNGYRPKIGVTAFAQNSFALVADILCAVSLIAFAGAMIMTKSTGYSCYIALSVLVFTFCMHCILNGRIFYYVQNQNKILAQQEHNK